MVFPPAFQNPGVSQVSDDAYGPSWSGDTATAPSKNALYNKIETITAGATDATDTLHGIFDGGNEELITINADTTLYDVAAFDYYINGVKYSYAGETGRPANFVVGNDFLIINIGPSGIIELSKDTFNNPGTLNNALELGGLGTDDGTNISFAGQSHFDQDTSNKDMYRWAKFAKGTDYIASAGSISENATNPFQLDIAGGSINTPDMKKSDIIAATNLTAKPYYHVSGDWDFQPNVSPLIVSSTLYDNGTDLVNISNNKWVSHNILRSSRTNTIYYVPSQAEYNTEAEAIDAPVSLGGFEGQIGTDVSPLAKIIVKQGTLGISQIVDVRNQATNIVSASTSTLQTTYDRSDEPEIITTVAKGALTIKGGTGVDTDNVYEGKSNAGDITFSVQANGLVNGRDIAGDGLKIDGIEAGAQVNSVTSVAARTGDVILDKSDVGLDNVDNTGDLQKPISTATQSALDGKLSLTGGTITGDISLSGNGLNNISSPATGTSAVNADYVTSQISDSLTSLTLTGSTSVISGIEASGVVGATVFDISSGTANFYDTTTNPNDPVEIKVSYPGATGLTIDGLLTQPITFVGINSSGAIIQQPSLFSPSQRRDIAAIAAILHPAGTIVDVQDARVPVPDQLSNQLVDLARAIGPINRTGNNFSGNPAGNLKIDKNAGTAFFYGLNRSNNPKDPSTVTLPSVSQAVFTYTWRDGVGGFNTAPASDINPGAWDDGTGGALSPNGSVSANRWSNHRIYISADNIVAIHYGQADYSNFDQARDALETESFESNPALEGSLFRGYIICRGAATDLTNLSDGVFVDASNFGGVGAAPVGGSSTDLQGSYNLSNIPQIITSAQGAMTVREGNANDANNVYQGQNNAGTTTFSVTGEGNLTANDVVVAGDLTVNGTTTTINSQTLNVEDKNVTIGDVVTPSDITADGGGITLKGSTDKTVTWQNSDDKWHFNQGISIDTGGLSVTGDITTASNVGVGTNSTIPWGASYGNVTLSSGGFSIASGVGTSSGFMCSNVYYDGTNWRLINNGAGYIVSPQGGSEAVYFYNVNNGAAGSVAVFEENLSASPSKVTLTTSKSEVVQRNKSTFGDASFLQMEGSTSLPVFIGVKTGDFTIQTPGSSYSDKLVVKPSGNVGMGVTDPSHKLEVSDNSDGQRVEIAVDNTDQKVVMSSYFEAGVSQYGIIQSTNDAGTLSQALSLNPDGGNVGVGTTTPNAKLEVSSGTIRSSRGNSDQYLEIDNTTSIGGVVTNHSREQNKKALYIESVHDGGGTPSGFLDIIFRNGNINSPQEVMRLEENGTVDITNNLVVDTDTLYVDTVTKRVGINTSAPTTGFTVSGGIDATSRIRAGGGTAASPSIQPGVDGDTGIFLASANTLGFSTLGSERVRIDSAGNVGIGTTSPNAKLEVGGVSGVDGIRLPDGTLLTTASTPSEKIQSFVERAVSGGSYVNPTLDTPQFNQGGFGLVSDGVTVPADGIYEIVFYGLAADASGLFSLEIQVDGVRLGLASQDSNTTADNPTTYCSTLAQLTTGDKIQFRVASNRGMIDPSTSRYNQYYIKRV